MTSDLPEYHQRIAAQNRAAVLAAATTLFLEHGYDGTSLARVAAAAGVSKATLFKQFPSKASLFEATVLAVGRAPDETVAVPPVGDLASGLTELGRAYADLLTQPGTADLIRLVITDARRFPELRERTFDFGTVPAIDALARYLAAERAAGGVTADAVETAPTQFLGMIASAVFWPQVLHPTWAVVEDETRRAVEEAVRTIVARYGS